MPKVRLIGILLLSIALATALAFAGCGSDSDETSGGGTEIAAPGGGGEPSADGADPGAEEGAPVGVRADVCASKETAGGDVRVTGISCDSARLVVGEWHENEDCAAAPGASRTSCRLGPFDCLGATTGSGLAVTCAASGRSIVFFANR
jgi:hypothetical protein